MVTGGGPVLFEVGGYGVGYAVGGFEGGEVGGVLADALSGEALGGSESAGGLVVVGDGAEDEDAVEVGFTRQGEVVEGLEGAGVFHSGGDEGSLTFGEVVDPVGGPSIEELAMPEGGGGDFVSEEDLRGMVGLGSVEVGADFGEFGAVVEGD